MPASSPARARLRITMRALAARRLLDTGRRCRESAAEFGCWTLLALHQNLANLGLKARNVMPHRLLGAIAVTREDRLEQRPVLGHRLAQRHALVEHEEPEAQAQVEVPLE